MSREDLIRRFEEELELPHDDAVELAAEFVRAIDEHLALAMQSLAASDWRQLAMEAHTIKGCAANAGCRAMVDAAALLQNCPAEDAPEYMRVIAGELELMK